MPERRGARGPGGCPAGKLLVRISCGQQLGGVLVDLVDRGVLVAAVEVAQEVGAVAAVELQQAGRLGQRAQHVAGPLRRRSSRRVASHE